MHRLKKYNFSLIELLVASAIFAILMVVTMNIFSLSMDVLSKNSQNTKISTAAQITLDYLEERLINCDRGELKANFASSAAINPTQGGPLKFNTLVDMLEDKALNQRRYGTFYVGLAEEDKVGEDNDKKAWSLKIQFDGEGDYNEAFTTILSNVTNFTVTAWDKEMAEITTETTETTDPQYININIEVLSPEDFMIWYNDGKNKNSDFYKNNVYKFSRIVTLPQEI